jgi:hypothetical protein
MQEEVDHPLYPRAPLNEADAVAWIFTSKDSDLQMYSFKFWPLEPSDVRLKILHTSICYSDIMHSRGYWGNSSSIQENRRTPAALATKSSLKSPWWARK